MKHKAARPRNPIILVGMKCDLRDPEFQDTVDWDKMHTFNDGVELASKIGAVEYMECSAKTGGGVKRLLDRAVEVGYKYYRSEHLKKKSCRKSKCHLL